ncbi:MAG: hypothetical protein IKI75_13210 [Lachnospiraceae bacterium]|nr:hypothetical protein [Lachnospiraceae bacterium]
MHRTGNIGITLLAGCILLAGCGNDPVVTGEIANTSAATTERVNGIDSLTPANDFYGYINAADIKEMELKDNQQKISTLGLISEDEII